MDKLTDKGVYPYGYMNSFDKYEETKLPEQKHFRSHLYEKDATDEEYNRAQDAYNHFNITNLGAYHDLYLMTDVYLLTDVFDNFRDMCLSYYGLDPAYYVTLPKYNWNVFLYMTGVKLEQIHNQDMYEMIEHGLRGGMTQCSYKKVEATTNI